MAGTDYGVITLKNGMLLKKTKGQCLQGTAGYFSLGNILIDRTFLYFSDKNSPPYDDFLTDNYSNRFSFRDSFEKNKKVLYLDFLFEGRKFILKTKALNKELDIFLTVFYLNNDSYKILHGYDVSLDSFHHLSTKKIVKKFLTKK